MKEKLRKLFQGNREDRIIACNLLVENYSVHKFITDWPKEDSTVYKFHTKPEPRRPGVQFVPEEEIEGDTAIDFYYHYSPRRWLLCTHQELIICYAPYSKHLEVIKHER